MPQFSVHRNRNAATRGRYPLLVDVQAGLLDGLATRVVIPLVPASAGSRAPVETLTPRCRIDGRDYLIMTPQLAGISARELGPVVGDLVAQRPQIVAALDLLFTGI
jgi:toxin CcdB